MGVNWTLATSIALLVAAAVHYAHFQVERRTWSAWTITLSGARAALARWLRAHTNAHLRALERTLRVARADHDEGQRADALDVIVSADALVGRHVAWLRAWLQRWADTARAHAALAPAPHQKPGPTALRPLRELAFAERTVAALLPTRSLRFQAQVRLQRTALQWLSWHASAASRRARRPGELLPALAQLDAACADLAALDRRALGTLEHLLLSLPPDALTGDGAQTRPEPRP